ncbi:MAG TPA: hypothetical protein VIY48_12860 [Candidatus Paceibacterota bacterium]
MTKIDRRQTEISIRAHEIFNEIKDLPHPFLKSYATGEDTLKIGDALRRLTRGMNITITKKPYVLYVGTKQKSLNDRMKDMIRRLALQIDDELLYDEAMELIHAYGGD